jgi:pimeloyl-ACP methyl ester carboxylesterase
VVYLNACKNTILKQILNKNNPVYYQFIDNNSDKTVVFLHGLFSSSSIFRHFLKLIKFNVILVELRGIVYSKCRKPYLDNYVEDIKLILEKENIQKNVILVGYSLGCSIANAFAEKYGNMVEKAILLAPINRKLRDIGKRNLVRSLITTFGKNFFYKWREYIKFDNEKPFHKIFGLFNFSLLKEVCVETVFTDKCKIVIINGGKAVEFFNNKDSRLKLPNIVYREIQNLDHFLFLTSERIQILQNYLIPHLEAV